MKQFAAVISLLIATVLLGSALYECKQDADNTRDTMSREFAERQDEVALNADFQASTSRKQSEEAEAIAGAAFLVAGFALFNKQAR